jgi:pentatricopeptide repeat protein
VITEHAKDLPLLNHALLKLFEKEGSTALAEDFFQVLKEKTVEHYQSLIRTYGNASTASGDNKAERVSQLVEEMKAKTGPITLATYEVVIQTFANLGNLDMMIGWYRQMKEEHLEATELTHASIILAYGKAGKLKEMMEWFFQMKTLSPSHITYDAVMDSFVNSNQPVKARHIYQQMLKDNVRPNIDTFKQLLKTVGLTQDKKELSQLLAVMEKQKIMIDSSFVSMVLDIFNSDFKYCWEFFQKYDHPGRVNKELYKKVLALLSKHYKTDLISSIRYPPPLDEDLWSAKITAFSKAQDTVGVVMELKRLRRKGIHWTVASVEMFLNGTPPARFKRFNGTETDSRFLGRTLRTLWNAVKTQKSYKKLNLAEAKCLATAINWVKGVGTSEEMFVNLPAPEETTQQQLQ